MFEDVRAQVRPDPRAGRNLGAARPAVLLALLGLVLIPGCESTRLGFTSPYDGVNWESVGHHMFDGHVHARRGSSVEDMVRAYAAMGYSAMAFGDFWLRWPLEDHLEDPDAYDITVFPGQGNLIYSPVEPFANHTKVWFSEVDYDVRAMDFDYEAAITAVGLDGGLAIFAHPSSPMYYPQYGAWVDMSWYVEQFDRHPHLVGLEVNNHGMEGSLQLFDELLGHYGPERLIVGFATSDTQGLSADGSIGSEQGFGFSILLAEDRDMASLRTAIEAGQVFWVDAPEPDASTASIRFPRVRSIRSDDGRIEVDVEGDVDAIRWIFENEVIHEGPLFTLADRVRPDQGYVRFEVSDGAGTTLGSQGFFIAPR
jgi:hypothetical protein